MSKIRAAKRKDPATVLEWVPINRTEIMELQALCSYLRLSGTADLEAPIAAVINRWYDAHSGIAAVDREPTDDDIYNGPGVEGGIVYGPDDSPGSLGEHDWRL